jgi:Mannose-6-phosphate isomerase
MWIFIEGTGKLIVDGVGKMVRRGDFVCIPPGMKHAIKACTELHIIEVQVGNELAEEDIERFDWDWNSVD